MNRAWILVALALFALAAVAIAPFVGMEDIPVSALWRQAEEGRVDVLWKIRVPRVAVAFLAGAGLATAGMVFQAMFRNPLATPFTLGVSSGASLGAAVSIHLGWTFSILGLPVVSWLAFAGAMAAILLVYGLTRTAQGFSTNTMLLAGVAVSFFFSSLILFLQYLSDPTQTFRLLRWTMGGLASVVGFDEVMSVLPFVASGCLIVLYMTQQLNLITTGEELAAARGVEVNQMKITLFFVASAIVGAVVAVCGPIGFVGLMAPHICRLLTGADHRYLAPSTVLFGGGFLVLCDTVARTVIAPTELPVGILTALMGGPFFLWLLLARSSRLETF
jgi:iron complex transport system permease protein